MNLKKIWADPVGSKVISSGLCVLGGVLITVLGGWGAIGHAILTAWDFMLASTPIPRWAIGFVGVWTAVATFILVGLWFQSKAEAAEANSWRSYRSDHLLGLRWRWYWNGQQPYGLHPFCPACDYQLDLIDDSDFRFIPAVKFQCVCGHGPWRFEESWNSVEQRVAKLIQQKLRNETWKK